MGAYEPPATPGSPTFDDVTVDNLTVTQDAVIGDLEVIGPATFDSGILVTGNITATGTIDSPTITALQNESRTVVKTVDTTRTATIVPIADPELVLSVEADVRYRLTCYMPMRSPAVADFKARLVGPAGASGQFMFASSGITFVLSSDLNCATLDANDVSWLIDGTLNVAGTAGNVQLEWSQVVSDPGDTILRSNAWLKLDRITP